MCVLLSSSNIFSSLHLMRSRHGQGTCAPTLWFPFSTKARKRQQLQWLHTGTSSYRNFRTHFSPVVTFTSCSVFVNNFIVVSILNRFNTIPPEGSRGKTGFNHKFDKYSWTKNVCVGLFSFSVGVCMCIRKIIYLPNNFLNQVTKIYFIFPNL